MQHQILLNKEKSGLQKPFLEICLPVTVSVHLMGITKKIPLRTSLRSTHHHPVRRVPFLPLLPGFQNIARFVSKNIDYDED